ncbi:ATP-binding cassette domain-containing protein [Methylomonas paludis]|uniref:ATP-binding cassette domain-containing protein n=1 Tax=Methylomonas paludis TaxID=1173101 RepID=A0A975MM54_9GAMM|nr:ABC transporter ATP-binding protein [Methylomonas paludis]QWF69866.1 ATP-binding cassette domain-containing protein [Methylomonas paludis]
MSRYALNIAELSFAYGQKKALDNVNIQVEPGECTILLGPNGAGKSTLFALITRLYDSRLGRIELCGYDVKTNSRQALAKLGVVFQQTTLDPDLSVTQNLRYHAALHGLSQKTADLRIQEELERLDMYERRHEKVRQLNGGHKRRVEIARALLHKPSLLLLDEPSVGLDVPSREVIVRHVHQLAGRQNLAVLWATHLFDEIGADDSLVVLDKGVVKAQGKLSSVLSATGTSSAGQLFSQLTQGKSS